MTDTHRGPFTSQLRSSGPIVVQHSGAAQGSARAGRSAVATPARARGGSREPGAGPRGALDASSDPHLPSTHAAPRGGSRGPGGHNTRSSSAARRRTGSRLGTGGGSGGGGGSGSGGSASARGHEVSLVHRVAAFTPARVGTASHGPGPAVGSPEGFTKPTAASVARARATTPVGKRTVRGGGGGGGAPSGSLATPAAATSHLSLNASWSGSGSGPGSGTAGTPSTAGRRPRRGVLRSGRGRVDQANDTPLGLVVAPAGGRVHRFSPPSRGTATSTSAGGGTGFDAVVPFAPHVIPDYTALLEEYAAYAVPAEGSQALAPNASASARPRSRSEEGNGDTLGAVHAPAWASLGPTPQWRREGERWR